MMIVSYWIESMHGLSYWTTGLHARTQLLLDFECVAITSKKGSMLRVRNSKSTGPTRQNTLFPLTRPGILEEPCRSVGARGVATPTNARVRHAAC